MIVQSLHEWRETMKDNDKLMLIDSWERIVPLKQGIERAVRSVTPIAKRFVFDKEACVHLGRVLFEASDLVLEQIVFAKPPYEHTYIELSDARAMFNSWRPTTPNPVATSDDKLGLLYTGDRIYSFCHSDTADIPTTLGMFHTTVGHGQTTPLREIFGDTSTKVKFAHEEGWQKYVKIAYLLGGMRQPDGRIVVARGDYEYFLDNYDLGCTIGHQFSNPESLSRHRNVIVDSAFMGGGDILIGAACLLLIHGTKRGVSIQNKPHQAGWFKGKRIVYKSHGVVTIKLTKGDSMKKVLFGTRESPKVHDVMGTWVHYHRDVHCDHEWVRLEDTDHERYLCRKCPTLRTWRTPHSRGEGGKGVHTKTYSVIK